MKPTLTLLLSVLLLAACDRSAPVLIERAAPVVPAVVLSDGLSDQSVYLLDAPWTDQSGEAASLQAFLGRPVVLTFVYTHCAATCPLLVHEMKTIAQRLDASVPSDVAYVLVTLDPERDTPEQLQKFAKAHGLSPAQWTLLRGSPESIRALAASISVGYRDQSDGQIAHANLLTILNKQGEVAAQVPGSGATDVAVQVLDSLQATPLSR